jgi:polyisoprenoid-binding protein YceI
VRDVTKSVSFEGEYLGASQTPWDSTVVGFTAQTVVNRKDWGLEWNMALEGGGVLVGEKITLTIDAEAVLQQ